MKEITRIHIAKIPYEAEVLAKKELEVYISNLSSFAEGQDWIEDIEIRITELLQERDITKNGLITSEDVDAIKEQLGSPADFTEDSDEIADLKEASSTSTSRKRLYRDMDDAMLGGVLSGLAKFIGIDATWMRLIFIILLFVSFGTATIVYLVLWLCVPAAETAAEKLQMEGKPITLNSIKKLREQANDINVNRIAQTTQSIAIYSLGTLATIAAVGSLIATVTVGFMLGTRLLNPVDPTLGSMVAYSSWELWLAYILFVVSGLLLTTLFSLIATSLFRKKLSRRVGITLIAITIAGMTTFGVGVGAMFYGAWQQNVYVSESQTTETIELPEEFSKISKFTVESNDKNRDNYSYDIDYIADGSKSRYELVTSVATSDIDPTIKISNDGSSASLRIDFDDKEPRGSYYANMPKIRVYGPTLTDITSKEGSITYKNNSPQESLTIVAKQGRVNLNGEYKNITARADKTGNITLRDASVDSLVVDVRQGTVNAGVIRNLTANVSDICPADSYYQSSSQIEIQSVISNEITFNGETKPARDIKTSCGEIDIDEELEDKESKEDN